MCMADDRGVAHFYCSTFLHNGVDPILVVQAASNGKGADADAHLNQEQ
jgi:hypothetical protein